MNYPDKIKTIEKFNEFTIKEKGSVFTGQVFKHDDEEQILSTMSEIKKKYYDASHRSYAYKLLKGKVKYSDDGEPKGTAGIRILNAIEHFGLVNQLVVVIRYFGGTKLGVGPLGKAYYTCAHNVLDNAKIDTLHLYKKAIVTTDFNNLNNMYRLFQNHNTIIEETVYGENVIFNCLIMPSDIEAFTAGIVEITSGNAEISVSEHFFYK
jgi:uncharacterized YigZ family protein